ncbi:type II toxin-antitoxin system prevent-host-death family antitoxin [Pseudaminobacter sp. 19-2017]|uniref:Antitoxin n=1 Tax=Pseudaminobacter soli (ex Zhang et al. 2022) TaxID=2831468 RepID=A0A942I971_9HYPH|nr:type II toxin-antitoxin system prevent-host-death family antitoxin [Pseudaminobacter soli]MBS3648996.1 type II toxin-antitoxin system prevent-host-death family antitoxin [Pseudaminobacter soli]
MRTVGAIEAKKKLDSLLDLIARGEEVVITRHGKPAAKLVAPSGEPKRSSQAADAVMRIRERRRGVTLGGISIRGLIDDGRK